MKTLNALLLLLVPLLFSTYSYSGIIQTYTDQSAFESLTGINYTATFTKTPPATDNGTGLTYDYGFFSITKEYDNNNGRPENNYWRGKPTYFNNDIIEYNRGLYAWGGLFDTLVGGGGAGIEIFVEYIGGLREQVGAIGLNADPNKGYIGFTTDMAFNKIIIRTSDLKGTSKSDTYSLRNVTAEIPEPSSGLLFIASLLGLNWLRRLV
ncbi:PEP-CTERM sorting domain-containing protein [Photobacterium sanctipauli]|uniref:PEP-CTERM sorting domain-containing protein n=1 Tax=Photobacterium sanctipauli TaxID=1342794 RepID=A0A2T3NZ05_9GAMM|nr:PEP-CTERM sorting domain-containing protein [Photobacterium sanctipauli]PSW21505.1 PEP-CTERM sorting domain-containing protein [Photobacterium sanctipauli]